MCDAHSFPPPAPPQATTGQAGPHLQSHARGVERTLPCWEVLWAPVPAHQGLCPHLLEAELWSSVSGPSPRDSGLQNPLTALPKDRKWGEQPLPIIDPLSIRSCNHTTFPSRCVLPWAEFQSLLCACHPVEPGPTMQALRSTLDLTCNGHVSVFEFDVFTRLFQVREGHGRGSEEGARAWTPGSEEGDRDWAHWI